MKRGAILVVILLALAALGLMVWRGLLHDGLSAKAEPSALETWIAGTMRNRAMPAKAQEEKNPVANSAEAVREGMLHFADHCAICHGNDGSGDTMMGHGMYPKPPDLRAAATQSRSDGEIFWIIENGVRLT